MRAMVAPRPVPRKSSASISSSAPPPSQRQGSAAPAPNDNPAAVPSVAKRGASPRRAPARERRADMGYYADRMGYGDATGCGDPMAEADAMGCSDPTSDGDHDDPMGCGDYVGGCDSMCGGGRIRRLVRCHGLQRSDELLRRRRAHGLHRTQGLWRFHGLWRYASIPLAVAMRSDPSCCGDGGPTQCFELNTVPCSKPGMHDVPIPGWPSRGPGTRCKNIVSSREARGSPWTPLQALGPSWKGLGRPS